jgi:hypothetical protein
MIIAGKGTTQQAKKFCECMLQAEVNSCICALSLDMGIPISELIQVVKGGDPTKQAAVASLTSITPKSVDLLLTDSPYKVEAAALDPGGDTPAVWTLSPPAPHL